MRNIFVSSTFQDMQAERDVIRQKVFPQINREAVRHNDNIEFVDLRWGIDTSDASEQDASIKILGACLNTLQRSDDLMIIFLGDRYGWVPDLSQLQKIRENYDISDELKQISATEFEIEQGVLNGNKKALVYIREFKNSEQKDIPAVYYEQNKENKSKLEHLKERLENSPNCKTQVYPVHFQDGKISETDLDALAELIVQDLKNAFCNQWQQFDQMSQFDREQEIQWNFLYSKAKKSYTGTKELDNLFFNIRKWFSELSTQDQITSAEEHIYYITGPSGSGKSSILSQVALEFYENGWDVLPFIGGLTAESSNAIRVLYSIIYYLEEQLEENHQELLNIVKELDKVVSENEKSFKQYYFPKETIIRERLQNRLIKLSAKYVQNHDPLIVTIDGLDQFYPDENRNMRVFCPDGLNGNIRFIITCAPDTRIHSSRKTYLQKLDYEEKVQMIHSILANKGKELSQNTIFNILKRKSSDSPLYISMVIDRLLILNQDDYLKIAEKGGDIDAISDYQNSIIESLPDSLEEMALTLYSEVGKKIGFDFTTRVLQLIAISRQGLRESDLAYCMKDKWETVAFSNLLYFLDDQFQWRIDGRVDFMHNTLRQGVISTMQDTNALHLQLEWCFHHQDTVDGVKAQELLYHCYCNNDYKYAATVVEPIVFQNYSNDQNILDTTNKRYAQTIADLALMDRGEWIKKWIHSLVDDAVNNQKNKEDPDNKKWNKLWVVLWFIDRYVLKQLPQTQSGYETGGSITKFLLEIIPLSKNGTWSEKDRKSVSESIRRNNSHYLMVAGHEWEVREARKNNFEKSRSNYEMQLEEDYNIWRQVFADCYYYIAVLKGASDQHVLISALEPASYGIKLLDNRFFVNKYLNEENCLIGMLYGCIGEVCQNLGEFEANLLAYEQDLRYREEIYNRNKSAKALLYYTGSYHNISIVYLNLGIDGVDSYEDIYSSQFVFFKNTKNPLKLLPVIRFSSGTDHTEGEQFMLQCHKVKPIIAGLVSQNREIELLEKAIAMNPDLERISFLDEINDLWYKYWFYSYQYFANLKQWDPTDFEELDYFCLNHTIIAVERLCMALQLSWKNFFNESIIQNIYGIIQVLQTFAQYSTYIKGVDNVKISQIFDECIQKAEEYLKLCIEQDKDNHNKNNIKMNATEYVKFILVYSCNLSSKIILNLKYTEYDEDRALKWCDIGESYILKLNIWIDDNNRNVITNHSPHRQYGDLSEQFEFDRYILNWCSECKNIRDFVNQQRELRNPNPQDFEGKLRADIEKILKQYNPEIRVTFKK